MYEAVLVATDGSADATAAAEHALALAARLEVPLYGLAVVETRTAYDNAIVDPEVVEAALTARAERALESVEALASEVGVPVTTACKAGVPHEEILEYVDEHDVDLVVVGTQGRSAFRRALLGSTADAVARLSPVPVLIVGDPRETRVDADE